MESQLIYSNISKAGDHYVICKYVDSKRATCGIGGGSGDQVLDISFCYFHCMECRRSILNCALMQFFFMFCLIPMCHIGCKAQ